MKRYFQMENGEVKVVSKNRVLRTIKSVIKIIKRLFLKVQNFIISVEIYKSIERMGVKWLRKKRNFLKWVCD